MPEAMPCFSNELEPLFEDALAGVLGEVRE
jgi:hypothetical protein